MADDSDSGKILDDEGRLFGLVNIVDILVVLLVVAVAVAGAALLLGGGEPDTRHATINLGEQPDFIAEEISEGDQFDPEGTSDDLTITDVYRSDGEGGTNVVVRATVNGTMIEADGPDEEPTFEFRGDPLRVGQELSILTTDYEVDGEVTQVQRSGERLPVQESSFLVETTVSESTADEVATGDEYRVAGETVAEITDIQQFPAAEEGERSLLIALSARTLERGGTLNFGPTAIRIGNEVPFAGDGYELSAEIVRRSTSAIAAEERPFVIETTVPADVADDITEGDQYQLSGVSLVTVESKTVYATDEPDLRHVVLGVSAATRDVDGTLLFGDRELRLGQPVPVRTGEYDIEGEIIRRGTLEEAGTPATRTVTVGLENIRPEQAAVIVEGLTEETETQTTAEIVSKTTEPAEVILESEDGNIFSREHPRNLDVELEVELSVRELADGTARFRTEPLRTGETLTLDFGEVRIQGDVRTLTD